MEKSVYGAGPGQPGCLEVVSLLGIEYRLQPPAYAYPKLQLQACSTVKVRKWPPFPKASTSY